MTSNDPNLQASSRADGDQRRRSTSGTAANASVVRDAIRALPEETNLGVPPSPSHVYLPPSHVKALDPNVQLVIGSPGTGKTFWWSALQERGVRQLVERIVDQPPVNENTEVRAAFGTRSAPNEYPDAKQLQSLMDDFEPKTVWRTVLAWQFARDEEDHPLKKCSSWEARTRYAAENPEAVNRMFQERDNELDLRGVHLLVLFDDLNRCADSWEEMYRAIRGLLQTALDLRSYKRLRLKVFLRSDQADRTQVADFKEAFMILNSAGSLNWPRRELYGLLWHYLGNGPYGNALRAFLGDGDWRTGFAGKHPAFAVPRELVLNEDAQRKTFHRIAGPSMDGNRRRWCPYAWVANQLEDTERRVSPQTFLFALETAADDTAEQHPDHQYALHYDSIKRGVRAASAMHIRELQADYPWLHDVMGALEGLSIPLEFEEIVQRWRDKGVLDEPGRRGKQHRLKSPPPGIAASAAGMRLHLESLGVLQRLLDGRINIPNIYRMGYGLGRRGSVEPAR